MLRIKVSYSWESDMIRHLIGNVVEGKLNKDIELQLEDSPCKRVRIKSIAIARPIQVDTNEVTLVIGEATFPLKEAEGKTLICAREV